jgi:hypothetical protein
VLLGIVFTGLMAGLLPHGSLGTSMRHDDPTSPLLMTLLGLPAYSGVLPGMMRIGLMFEHGNSVGASWVLFELGVGMNLGLIVWLVVQFGWRRMLLWLAGIVVLVVALGYAAERPLYFAGEEASHTHAFDDWTSPFTGSDATWAAVGTRLLQKIEILEPVSLSCLALLVIVGLVAWRLDRSGWLEGWLTAAPPPETKPGLLNWKVPGPVLGLVALAGLVVFSVVALYIYYPPPQEVFDEMSRVRANAVLAIRLGQKEEGIRQLSHWDLLTRKLQVGVFLRTGKLDPEAAKRAEALREELEAARDALLAGDLEQAITFLDPIQNAYNACRAAFVPK